MQGQLASKSCTINRRVYFLSLLSIRYPWIPYPFSHSVAWQHAGPSFESWFIKLEYRLKYDWNPFIDWQSKLYIINIITWKLDSLLHCPLHHDIQRVEGEMRLGRLSSWRNLCIFHLNKSSLMKILSVLQYIIPYLSREFLRNHTTFFVSIISLALILFLFLGISTSSREGSSKGEWDLYSLQMFDLFSKLILQKKSCKFH